MQAPIQALTKRDTARLRRHALTAQRLDSRAPFGAGPKATRAAIEHLGSLQIDTISVVARAHHHIAWTRVPGFKPAHLHRLLGQRAIFEYRFPVAAFRPMAEFRYTLPHQAEFRGRGKSERRLMREVLARIEGEGPLRSRDFEAPPKRKGQGWWDWKPAKRALEQLYMQGDLMIAGRDGFQKTYDLTERVLPDGVDVGMPTKADYADYLIDSTLRAHGFGAYTTFGFGGRWSNYAQALRAALARRVDAGELVVLQPADGKPIWAPPDLLDRRAAAPRGARVLSPFDPIVTQRERLQAVFGFDYNIECFVPEPKRQYGYYCLPLLVRDSFVGRMDCKTHRDAGRFEIKALFIDAASADDYGPLAKAIRDYARFEGTPEVTITEAQPAAAGAALADALKAL
ncbi:MAG: crosslink repair DNA glycosylase YcaQ family protein [Pseudomonadota bacterium]